MAIWKVHKEKHSTTKERSFKTKKVQISLHWSHTTKKKFQKNHRKNQPVSNKLKRSQKMILALKKMTQSRRQR